MMTAVTFGGNGLQCVACLHAGLMGTKTESRRSAQSVAEVVFPVSASLDRLALQAMVFIA